MNIKKLEIGTHLVPNCPGLRVERRATVTTWTYRFRNPEGKLKQVALGTWPAVSLAEAMGKWEAARATKHEVTKREALTVDALLRRYCIDHLQARRKQPAGVEAMLWRHTGKLRDMGAETVGRREAFELLNGLRGTPAIQRMLKTELSACWNYGMNAGLIEDGINPFARVPVIPGKPRQRVLNDGELKVWLPWLDGASVSSTVRDVLMLVLLTGARGGEVCRMAWADVDLAGGTWMLRGTKNGTDRQVQLVGWALEILKRRALGHDGASQWVFPSRDGRKHFQQVCLVVALHRVKDACPIKGWSGHDLRRTCRTGLSMLGVRREVAEQCLGHTVGGVEGTYNVWAYLEEQRAALELWGNHLRSLRGEHA